MGAGMLRAHVQEQLFAPSRSALLFGCPIDLLFSSSGISPPPVPRGLVQTGMNERTAPASPFSGKVFCAGMPLFVVVRQKNATKVRMPDKGDPHEVAHFALHEFGTFQIPGDGGDLRRLFCDSAFSPIRRRCERGEQLINHPKPFRVVGVVDGANIGDVIERRFGRVVQPTRDVHDPAAATRAVTCYAQHPPPRHGWRRGKRS